MPSFLVVRVELTDVSGSSWSRGRGVDERAGVGAAVSDRVGGGGGVENTEIASGWGYTARRCASGGRGSRERLEGWLMSRGRAAADG